MTNWQIIWTSLVVMVAANVGQWLTIEDPAAFWVITPVWLVALIVLTIFFTKEISS